MRELLPLVLAATYQTVPTFPSSDLLPTQATKNYFFKKLLGVFFLGGWEEFYFLFLKDKNKKMEVFYCRKPHSSEQIRSCCTIVLVGAINCGVGEDVYMLMHKGHNENKYKLVYEN